jgi:hypothetical protein
MMDEVAAVTTTSTTTLTHRPWSREINPAAVILLIILPPLAMARNTKPSRHNRWSAALNFTVALAVTDHSIGRGGMKWQRPKWPYRLRRYVGQQQEGQIGQLLSVPDVTVDEWFDLPPVNQSVVLKPKPRCVDRRPHSWPRRLPTFGGRRADAVVVSVVISVVMGVVGEVRQRTKQIVPSIGSPSGVVAGRPGPLNAIDDAFLLLSLSILTLLHTSRLRCCLSFVFGHGAYRWWWSVEKRAVGTSLLDNKDIHEATTHPGPIPLFGTLFRKKTVRLALLPET